MLARESAPDSSKSYWQVQLQKSAEVVEQKLRKQLSYFNKREDSINPLKDEIEKRSAYHLQLQVLMQRQMFQILNFPGLTFRYNRKKSKPCKSKIYKAFFGDPAGIRTQDPILKRDVLYQLSY